MKKLFVISMAIIAIAPLCAKMVYDPVLDTVTTMPAKPNIDQNEYRQLLVACIVIERNMAAANGGVLPSKKLILKQYKIFLKKIGTPTALRLLSDFKKNKLYYPDGSVARKIFS